MADPGQPLAEVFGHLTTDHTEKANRYRSQRLCPFNNKVPNILFIRGNPQRLGKENYHCPVAANESTRGSNESTEQSSQWVRPEDRAPGSTVE